MNQRITNLFENLLKGRNIFTLVKGDEIFFLKKEEAISLQFWSSEEEAIEQKIGIWQDYNLDKINLSTFLERYCIVCFNYNFHLGFNHSQNPSFILTISPLSFLEHILNYIIEKDINIEYTKFYDSKDFLKEVLLIQNKTKRLLNKVCQ